MQILVVDDDALGAESLAALLRARGHDVEFAVAADGALARLRIHSFDALVVDHYLPDLDGLTIARRVRERPEWAAVPVILLTAAADAPFAEIAAELMTLRPARALRKPCDVGEVLAAIERLIERAGRQ